MTNNSFLRRIRYAFDFSDSKMITLFGLGGHEATREQVCNWLKGDEDSEQQSCHDVRLAAFLNGLIVDKRGKRDGPAPVAEKRLGNNLILKKLKIALNLTSEDILTLLESVEQPMGKTELSAFFRKPGHKNYRECKDQVLRNLLKGLQLKNRPSEPEKPVKPPFKWK